MAREKKFIINPESPLKETWDVWIILLTIYTAIEIPLRLAFDYPVTDFFMKADYIVLFSFLLDIPSNFFTGYYRGLHLVTNRKLITKRYLRSWFIVDLLAVLPIIFIGTPISPDSAKVMRLFRIFQLNRLLKLTRLARLARSWQEHHMINPSLFRMVFFVFFISLIAHWIACAWIALGAVQPDLSIDETYSRAIYWVITTLTTVGYGDITPVTSGQRYFTMMVMIAGVGSYGYLIGNVAGFLSNMDIVKANYRRKLDEVNAMLNYRSVPNQLRKRVLDYYEHIWESRLGHNEFTLLKELPDSLRTDLALFFRRDLLQKVPFFRGADDALIRDIVLMLRPTVFTPNSYVMHKGESGDCMYIISDGAVEILNPKGESVAEIKTGSFVGEMALVRDMPRSATVRTVGYCDLYILEKSDFIAVLNKHPEFRKHVREITDKRLKDIQAREGKGQSKGGKTKSTKTKKTKSKAKTKPAKKKKKSS